MGRAPAIHSDDRAASRTAFETAAHARRELVYEYLDRWPGAVAFQPEDIHDALFSYVRRRGKALRPLLLLLSCGALGGDESQALPAAAAVEVFHTWTLVHDDIIDRDETRRGSPTVHSLYATHASRDHDLGKELADHYGTAVAILAGDLQQSWTYSLLAELPRMGVDPAIALALIERMAGWLTPELMEGEMLDVQYSLLPIEALNEKLILRMLTKKTAALLEYAAWAGARIALGTSAGSDNNALLLGKFASLCGTAFQLRDDLLGLKAEGVALGKPVGSDLREGKRTLIVYRALGQTGPSGRKTLLEVLGNPLASAGQVEAALAVLDSSGAFDYVEALAESLVETAREALTQLPRSEHRSLLFAWSEYLLARTH